MQKAHLIHPTLLCFMLINSIKFIHLLFTLGLIVSTIYCFKITCVKFFNESEQSKVTRINKGILFQLIFATLTGALLIYPKQFTIYTPWIQAAFLLVTIFSFFVLAMIFLRKKIPSKLWPFAYIFLLFILFFVVHDAVTKVTIL